MPCVVLGAGAMEENIAWFLLSWSLHFSEGGEGQAMDKWYIRQG